MGNHRVVLIGAVHEAMDGLRAIDEHPDAELGAIVTLSPEAAAGVSGAIDLATAARDRGIRVLYVDDVNAPASISAIRDLDPALIAVIGWTRLIGAELLAVPRHGRVRRVAARLPAPSQPGTSARELGDPAWGDLHRQHDDALGPRCGHRGDRGPALHTDLPR